MRLFDIEFGGGGRSGTQRRETTHDVGEDREGSGVGIHGAGGETGLRGV